MSEKYGKSGKSLRCFRAAGQDRSSFFSTADLPFSFSLRCVDVLLPRGIFAISYVYRERPLSLWKTVSACRQKAILPPKGGRIALSANERIAESLDFAIQAKFAYVNKSDRFPSGKRSYLCVLILQPKMFLNSGNPPD